MLKIDPRISGMDGGVLQEIKATLYIGMNRVLLDVQIIAESYRTRLQELPHNEKRFFNARLFPP